MTLHRYVRIDEDWFPWAWIHKDVRSVISSAAVSGTLIDQQALDDIRTVLRWGTTPTSIEHRAAVGRLRNLLEEA